MRLAYSLCDCQLSYPVSLRLGDANTESLQQHYSGSINALNIDKAKEHHDNQVIVLHEPDSTSSLTTEKEQRMNGKM